MTVELKLLQSDGLECVIKSPDAPDVVGKLQITEASKYVPLMFSVTSNSKYICTTIRFFENDVESMSAGAKLYIQLKR